MWQCCDECEEEGGRKKGCVRRILGVKVEGWHDVLANVGTHAGMNEE